MYKDEYRRWCRQVKEDYLLEELNAIKDNDREIRHSRFERRFGRRHKQNEYLHRCKGDTGLG